MSYASNRSETMDQAIARITWQIMSGERTFDSVRTGIGSTSVGMGAGGDSLATQQGAAAVHARVTQMFRNRGITPANYNQQTAGDPATPGVPGVPTTPENTPETVRDRASAFATIMSTLDRYGLGSLGPAVQRWLIDDIPASQIDAMIRESPEFVARFPAIQARTAAGLSPISPEEYVSYERSARQIMASAGLPVGFFDANDDFTGFLTGDVSIAELGARVQEGYVAVAYAPPEVRDAFTTYFGADGDAALAAYFLDTARALPLLEKQVAIGQVGGAATMSGFGLGFQRATDIADAGVGFDGARQGFQQINEIQPLFEETISETRDLTAEGEGVDATFGIGDKDARRAIDRRRGERVAAVEGSGSGALVSQRGVVGLGAADS